VGRAETASRIVKSRPVIVIAILAAVLVAAVAVPTVYLVHRSQTHVSGQLLRPAGLPPGISASLADLMALSPVPATSAPDFTLTDQNGRVLSLSAFRGKAVVLEFMDPHCVDICPIVSDEFIHAYRDLGSAAGKVVFAAVNVNKYHSAIREVAQFSRAHQLSTIPGWHFFTGPVPRLQATWRAYNILVQARGPNADIVHSSDIYFIDPQGRQRYMSAPEVDYTKSGDAYLPPRALAEWGRGIALVARNLVR